jgi:hypothetical protein
MLPDLKAQVFVYDVLHTVDCHIVQRSGWCFVDGLLGTGGQGCRVGQGQLQVSAASEKTGPGRRGRLQRREPLIARAAAVPVAVHLLTLRHTGPGELEGGGPPEPAWVGGGRAAARQCGRAVSIRDKKVLDRDVASDEGLLRLCCSLWADQNSIALHLSRHRWTALFAIHWQEVFALAVSGVDGGVWILFGSGCDEAVVNRAVSHTRKGVSPNPIVHEVSFTVRDSYVTRRHVILHNSFLLSTFPTQFERVQELQCSGRRA